MAGRLQNEPVAHCPGCDASAPDVGFEILQGGFCGAIAVIRPAVPKPGGCERGPAGMPAAFRLRTESSGAPPGRLGARAHLPVPAGLLRGVAHGEAWHPLLFADNELAEGARTRDPVASAEPSASAKRQKATRRAEDGTLLEDLANVMRNVCRAKGQEGSRQSEFELDAQLSEEHARAMELLKGIRA